jgi:arginine:ornithine antiporter/lysine permease
VLRGVKEAAAINKIVTIAKLIPLLLFVVLSIFFFKPDVFVGNLWGGASGDYGNLFAQIKATMLVTVFVFLGIEGASNYSRFAQRREDVGIATVTGFLAVLALFASVSILAYGILPREELAQLRQPSVGGVLEAAVGHWGAIFIGIGVIISVLGAYLAWTLMAAEVLSVAAKRQDMPAFLARENANQVPSMALLMSTLLVQAVLIATLFSDDAFTFALSLCSHLSLIPYFLSAAFALMLVYRKETYETDPSDLRKDTIIAVLATAYTIFLLFAGGMKFLLLGFIIYAPGTILYFITRRELKKQLFTPAEWVLFGVAVVGCVVGIHGLATGYISI